VVDQRLLLLGATLGFLSVERGEPELCPLDRWFDTWRGGDTQLTTWRDSPRGGPQRPGAARASAARSGTAEDSR